MQRTTTALVLAAVVLLAGCATGPAGSSTASPTATTAASTTATTAASTTDTADPTTTEPASTTSTTTSTSTSTGNGSDTSDDDSTDASDGDDSTDASELPDASSLADAATSSLVDADGVVVEGTIDRRVETQSGTSEASIEFVERVDAADRELGVERTVNANGRTVETATYLVNGTLYERSPAYERQYGSEWVRLPAEDAWTNASSTAVVARLVNASTATVVENTTVDGEQAVVLALDVDTKELAALSGYPVDDESINALSGTLTVDAESGQVYAASVHVNRTVENQYGQEVTIVTDVSRTFTTYGPVTVSLPDEAVDATPINATQT